MSRYAERIIAGSTDVSIPFELLDGSNDPITDADAAALTIKIATSPTSTPSTLSLSDLGSVGASHSDGGVIHVNNGVYRLDLPDSAVASAWNLIISLEHADCKKNWIEPVVVDTPTTLAATLASILTDTGTDIPALIAALNDLSAAEVNAEVDAALADYDSPTKAEMDAGLAALNDLSAAEVFAQVGDALTTYDPPTKAELDAAVTDLAGDGAYTVTVTVTDGTDPLEGARVRLTEGASTFVATTDASGEAAFALDAATYSVAVTKAGYQFTPTTRTATGEEAGTLTDDLEMTLRAEPSAPADPSLCAVYIDTRDILGQPVAGLKLAFDAQIRPSKVDALVVANGRQVAETGSDGRATISLLQDVPYRVESEQLFAGSLGFTPTGSTLNLASLLT